MKRYNTVLYSLNPVAKIVMLLALVVPVSFSQSVSYPLALLFCLAAAGWVFSGLSPLGLFKSLRVVLVAAGGLCVFLVFTRAFGQTGDLQLGIFGLRYADIGRAVSLALRMLGFAYAALLFTKTTDPVTLVLSLIQSWHLPYQAGYAFLVAYRLVPSFQEELCKIKTAHEVRGIRTNSGVFSALWQAPSYLIPLLVGAVRTGERVAISMDARAFGLYEERSYYKTVPFGKREKWALGLCLGGLCLLTAAMGALGLFGFSLGLTA